MSYVLTFTDFTPTPRVDGLPWTHVTIEEAAAADGAFTQIDDLALSPLDTDPAHPVARSFTTDNATLSAGWYRITFLDAAGDAQPVEPLYHAARGRFLPTVADVGAQLRVRTRDENGNELGTFTQQTRPTDDQVRILIALADSKIASRFGDNLPASLVEKARLVTALRAAMFVELSFFGDQIAAGRSPYNELKTLHDEEFADLLADWKELGADLEPGTGDDSSIGGGVAVAWPVELASHAPGSELPTAGPVVSSGRNLDPGATFQARVKGFPTGLAGTVGIRLLDSVGNVLRGRTTFEIVEEPGGSGEYVTTISAPLQSGTYTLLWDWDNADPIVPAHTASEDIYITAASAPAKLVGVGQTSSVAWREW